MSSRYQLKIEPLEARRVLASIWQAASNPYDVDNSGLVAAIDVLQIVNDINQNGVRLLPESKPSDFSGALCDVNGDGRLSALDALLVINVINLYPDPPTLSLDLSADDDPNGDEVVLSSQVLYQGHTAAESKVVIEFIDAGEIVHSDEIQTDANGAFDYLVSLPAAVNHVRFNVTDLRGRQIATERITRVGDVTTAWNAALLEMVRETTNVLSSGILQKPPPPMVAKYLAMMHGAMFDAMNATTGTYHGYAFELATPVAASPIAAAAQAAHAVASYLYPTAHQLELWDKTLSEVLATVPNGPSKTAGLQLGQQAAQAMIAKRANDGSSDSASYSPVAEIGHWKPTPPAFIEATLPQWAEVTPFVLDSGDQFRPAAPPDLSSQTYAEAVDEVLRVGGLSSTERTADQTAIAHFWADGGGTSTPPGHWNSIAIDVALSEGLSPLESSRLLALLNFALADAGISAWDAKYGFDLWRPIDAIREAAVDGNPNTEPVSDWQPLLTTPSFPTYTSGHSTFSGAAAQVLTAWFGEDYSFSTRADRGSSGQWPPSDDTTQLAVRAFDSFWDAANEAGMSRIYGGIHFGFDNSAGLNAGLQVGQWITDNALKPI